MSSPPLFPEAVAEIERWLADWNDITPVELNRQRQKNYVRAWQLGPSFRALGGRPAFLCLPVMFPLKPAEVSISADLCLVLPHIGSDGNLCHGITPLGEDLVAPREAVGRVIQQLDRLLDDAYKPERIEAEFHRERETYWSRHVSLAARSKEIATTEIFVDVKRDLIPVRRVSALHLGNGSRGRTKALVTDHKSGPSGLARDQKWDLGTVVHGEAMVATLPTTKLWTPETWPRSVAEIQNLMKELESGSGAASSNFFETFRSKDAPVFIILFQESASFGWRIVPPAAVKERKPMALPVKVTRIDRQWALARDQQLLQLVSLEAKRVAILGCGSLGAPTAELLARAGVGALELIDSDTMKPENIARHPLGLESVGAHKSTAMSNRLKAAVPGLSVTAHQTNAQDWLHQVNGPLDLILDCTGEPAVRLALSALRSKHFPRTPIVMGWMEPFGAASQIVTLLGEDAWPPSDPIDLINVVKWPEDPKIVLPGCGSGFHPFGMADAWRTASLIVERALEILKGTYGETDVISLIRSRAFIDQMAPGAMFSREVPHASGFEMVIQRRTLRDTLA